MDLSSAADSIFDSMLLMSHFKRPLSAACWLLAEFLSPVIPGHREAVGPESRAKFAIRSSGFRVRAHSASKTRVNALMSAPRNDRGEFFSKLLKHFRAKWAPVRVKKMRQNKESKAR